MSREEEERKFRRIFFFSILGVFVFLEAVGLFNLYVLK